MNTQFTMEMDGHLPFLDIDIYRRPDGFLGHEIHRKPTHTHLCLNPRSHYHPFNIQAWYTEPGFYMKRKASTMSGISSIPHFGEHGYSIKQIRRFLNSEPKYKFTSAAFLPYVQTTYG